MTLTPYELELPFEGSQATTLARLRVDHLRRLDEGLDDATVARLVRGFRSLRALYAASDAELAAVVGPVQAARIRWFLDAPLDTRLAAESRETDIRVPLRVAA